MKAWEEFCDTLKADLGSKAFTRWIATLEVLRYDACNIYVEAQDSFQANWFNEHVRPKSNVALVNENNKKIKVHLSVKNELPPSQELSVNQPAQLVAPVNTAVHEFKLTFDGIDPFSTFDNFVVCDKNFIAYKLLSQLSGFQSGEIKPHEFNPVYIWGGSGAGKSHLLMACAHEYAKKGMNVCYTRANTFTDHVVAAIRSGEMQLFRQSYRNNDVLIIDDIHTFARKAATQEELFHTFNTLHLAGKQILLSANCSPGELQAIEPRLVSRFEWGIAVPIESYTKEDACSILQKKTEALGFTLPSRINEFLLETFASSTKSLIKALEALILRTHLRGEYSQAVVKSLTVPLVKQHLGDLIRQEEYALITSDKIILNTAEHFGIRPEDILSASQNRECTQPRQIAMTLCRLELKLPYTQIARIFNRDHSTVMSSIKLINQALQDNNIDISAPFYNIQKKLKAPVLI